jgi:acyl-homoserine-lactone acylase
MKNLFLLFISIQTFAQINPANIQIARDKWGVPHIFGKTDPEVAYGLAYAHAEDDFETIQFTLLAAKGMLGQVKGKEAASADFVVQFLRCREVVEQQYDTALSADFKALIEGYVAGMNAYAREHPSEVLLKKAFPINIKDYMTAITLSLSVISGVDGTLNKIFNGKVKTLEQFKSGGSNAFAIHSSKTTDGKTYLAINSHQPLEGPVSWYEAHLHSEQGWNIIGALFPGSCLIFLGANEHLGWAHTVNYNDKIDVFQLEIDPKNPLKYKFDGEWLDLEERSIKLKVKVGGLVIPVKKKAFWSKYGATIRTKQGTFAVRLGATQDIRGLEQWYRMNKSRNFSQFYKAMEMTAIPGFNTIYADKYDTIFYVSNGKIPFREQGHDWKNTIIGNTSKTLWTNFHPLKDLPQYVNPKAGYLFNTNNTPFDATAIDENLKEKDFDSTIGIETLNNNRSLRFQELISSYPKLNYEDFKRIKYDNQLPSHGLAYPINVDELFNLQPSEYPDIEPIIENLNHWNQRADADSKGAAVFAMFVYTIREEFDKKGKALEGKLSKDDALALLRIIKTKMLKNFGRTDIVLGDYQVHARGNKEIPCWGIPDVLTAIGSRPYKNGKIRAYQGESHIELVQFSKDGLPEIESVLCYGASSRPDSPHYNDQMEMFIEKKTKKMTLEKSKVLETAVKIYSPK